MELNVYLEESYNKLLKIFAELDQHGGTIISIGFQFYAAISDLSYWAKARKKKRLFGNVN